MKICVAGATHLGIVTGLCAAQEFAVDIFDPSLEVIVECNKGNYPIFEEGLKELRDSAGKENLPFSNNPEYVCLDTDILWICKDTPVADDNTANTKPVLELIDSLLSFLKAGSLVLISSQLPVGTCTKLRTKYPKLRFAVSPENLQLGKAVKCFNEAERVICGIYPGEARTKEQLTELFTPFTREIVWVTPESAEMTKHALNCFLSMSIAFSNEIGRICEKVGADVKEVEASLKKDIRIGPHARLNAGMAYEGSSLAREVSNMTSIGQEFSCNLRLIPAIKLSNDEHRSWTVDKVKSLFPIRPQLTIALIGLTFKAGTHTLKRSGAVDLAKKLHSDGFKVTAYDPSVKDIPEELPFLRVRDSVRNALFDADAAVLCTPWPEFLGLDWKEIGYGMRRRVIVDANGFLSGCLKDSNIQHIVVGRQ